MDSRGSPVYQFDFDSGTKLSSTLSINTTSSASSSANNNAGAAASSSSKRHGKDDDQRMLTTSIRPKSTSNRPHILPKRVSHLGPASADKSSNAADDNHGNHQQGKGIRAARNRGALADLFPEAAAQISTSATASRTRSVPDITTATNRVETEGDEVQRGSSHELSASPLQTSNGIVDQMLSSFDQLDLGFGTGAGSSNFFYADPDRFPIGSRPSSRTVRHRGHTYSSSTSSNNAPNPYGSPNSRSKHTKNKSSSSNFYTHLDRVDSARALDNIERRPSTQGAATVRGRRNSKIGSVLSSGGAKSNDDRDDDVDAPLSKGFGPRSKQNRRRSASFDQSYVRNILASSTVVLRDPVTMAEYDDLNAAPEPSVRPGPRRMGESNTIASVGSQAMRGREGGRILAAGIRTQGASPQRIPSFDPAITSDDARRGAAPLYRDGPMQAPPISNQRQPAAAIAPSYKATAFSTNTKDSSKEKGGFFKRMFGGGGAGSSGGGSGSKNTSTSTTTSQQQDMDSAAVTKQSSYDQLPPASRGRQAQARAQAKAQEQEEKQQNMLTKAQQQMSQFDEMLDPPRSRSEQKDPPQTLNKKSSFFRRRKKSVAAATPPVPVLPNNTAWGSEQQQREHSPASSLRKVMNPYLGSRPGTRAGRSGSVVDKPAETRLAPVHDSSLDLSGRPVEPRGSQDNVDNGASSGKPNLPGTLVIPRAGEGPPRPSTSRTRSDTARPPMVKRGDSYSRSTRTPSRNDADAASETDDNDFISAKSQINSPVDDDVSEVFQPPAPVSAPPAIPVATSKVESPKLRKPAVDPGRTPTVATSGTVLVAPPEETDDAGRPTDDDYDIAYQLFRFNPSDPPRAKASLPMNEDDICPWLGEAGPERARIRRAYMEQFDWRSMSILTAVRKFCEHVRLKGETQQQDRIFEAIGHRWCDCNPSHSFKSPDVVHTIIYSILLLNTDLHLADIDSKMTRSQFIKNTVPTVMNVLDVVVPDAFDKLNLKRISTIPPNSAPPDVKRGMSLEPPKSPHSPTVAKDEGGTIRLTVRRNSNEFLRNKFRLSARPSDNDTLENLLLSSLRADNEAPSSAPPTAPTMAAASSNEDCGPLVKQPFLGGRAAWESQLETVLKNFYNSIQKQRLPLQGSEGTDSRDWSRAPSSVGQTGAGASVRRTPSITSKQSDGRGRNAESRGAASVSASSRWTSRHRGRPRVYAASSISVDDDMSMAGMSPSASSLWSKHSFGRTQTSMSVQSFGSEAPGKEAYQQSIGFANALSQAIIREEGAAGGGGGDDSDGEALKAAPLLEDETLELYGAPWAKEGIVKHKHHLETLEKKAKERAWTECFAVIEKGWLRLFRFSSSSKASSLRSKALKAAVASVGSSSQSVRAGASGSGGGKLVVGGGNWMDNALPIGRFLLRQTIASALPPPGYSKSRPHVWALSLPTGAVHLFQAGTPEIVREYVTCANYWSARLSKEPLTGGVSNVEYGWSEGLIGDLVTVTQQQQPQRPGSREGSIRSVAMAQRPGTSESFNTKRQRSASTSSAATQIPGVPRTSRGFSIHNSSSSRPPSSMHNPRPSLQTSIRSSLETTTSAVIRPRLPGDHVKIADWTPPPQSMVASALMEVDQLRVLTDYVTNIKRELERHNELRPAIVLAYSPRHPNHAKALANFERKSAYLLREIVKFSTYVETLQTAQTKKEEVYRERDDRKRELEEERSREAMEKVETAEELRRELSRSDLRIAALSSYDDDDDDDVPEVPQVPAELMKMISYPDLKDA